MRPALEMKLGMLLDDVAEAYLEEHEPELPWVPSFEDDPNGFEDSVRELAAELDAAISDRLLEFSQGIRRVASDRGYVG